jgi:hypothetical protein
VRDLRKRQSQEDKCNFIICGHHQYHQGDKINYEVAPTEGTNTNPTPSIGPNRIRIFT